MQVKPTRRYPWLVGSPARSSPFLERTIKTMKIAINKCFGGFTLSDKVHEKLIELGIPHYKTWDEIPKTDEPYVVDSDNPSDTFGSYYSNFGDDDKRTHPILIQAIEAVGITEASGRFGEIRIIDIPDDIQFEITDYDGIESIHELHRSW